MITMLAALSLSAAISMKPRRKHRPPPSRDMSILSERIERRRAVRLAVISALTRRETALEDFLVTTSTETPLLAMRDSVAVGPFEVGPTLVGLDFLGSPIVRATVRNRSSAPVAALLVAHLAYGGGLEAVASVAVDTLGPGESRSVKMLCPAAVRPTALSWTVDSW